MASYTAVCRTAMTTMICCINVRFTKNSSKHHPKVKKKKTIVMNFCFGGQLSYYRISLHPILLGFFLQAMYSVICSSKYSSGNSPSRRIS